MKTRITLLSLIILSAILLCVSYWLKLTALLYISVISSVLLFTFFIIRYAVNYKVYFKGMLFIALCVLLVLAQILVIFAYYDFAWAYHILRITFFIVDIFVLFFFWLWYIFGPNKIDSWIYPSMNIINISLAFCISILIAMFVDYIKNENEVDKR